MSAFLQQFTIVVDDTCRHALFINLIELLTVNGVYSSPFYTFSKNMNKDIFDVLRASLATQALFSQSSQFSAFIK